MATFFAFAISGKGASFSWFENSYLMSTALFVQFEATTVLSWYFQVTKICDISLFHSTQVLSYQHGSGQSTCGTVIIVTVLEPMITQKLLVTHN